MAPVQTLERTIETGLFRTLIENYPDATLLLDEDRIIHYLNPAALVLFDDEPGALEGTEFSYPIDTESVRTLTYINQTGETVTVELRMTPIIRNDDTLYLATFHDITHRVLEEQRHRQLESRVQYQQRIESLGSLAGSIANQFNNLLMVILGNVGLAKMNVPADSTAMEKMRQIEGTIRKISELTNHLFVYSGKGKFIPRLVHISRFIEEMRYLIDVTRHSQVVVETNLADDIGLIEADDSRLRQLILNLVANASEAIGTERGYISITTGSTAFHEGFAGGMLNDEELPPGEYIYLQVSDTGRGMDERTLNHIFEPFYMTKNGSNGLGLSAVFGIVRAHRGGIQVHSRPDQGTTVEIFFPKVHTVPVEPVQSEESGDMTTPTGSGTILIADDEEDVLTLVRDMLDVAGFKVLSAEDGTDAVQLFRKHANSIRLVILDVTMPTMGGEEAFESIRKIRRDVPVIFTSGYIRQEALADDESMDSVHFIQKPFDLFDLLNEVKDILGDENLTLDL